MDVQRMSGEHAIFRGADTGYGGEISGAVIR
jgi:hypothetical protein